MKDAIGRMYELIQTHYVSQCLHTFVRIGAPNAMGGDELTPAEIGDRLDV